MKRILINSKDRIAGTASDARFSLQHTYRAGKVALQSFSILNTFYTLPNPAYVVIRENNPPFTNVACGPLAAGTYYANDLALALKSAINAQPGLANTYDVEVSPTTLQLVITTTVTVFTFDIIWDPAVFSALLLASTARQPYVFGYSLSPAPSQGYHASQTSPGAVQVANVARLGINIDLFTAGTDSTSGHRFTYLVDNNVPFGDWLYYRRINDDDTLTLVSPATDLFQINIQLTDFETGSVLDTHLAEWSAEILIFC